MGYEYGGGDDGCRKLCAVIGALCAMGIAIPFTVLYANEYHNLSVHKVEYSCVATRMEGNQTNTADATAHFLWVLNFGYIYYLVTTCCLIFTCAAVFHPIIGCLNGLW